MPSMKKHPLPERLAHLLKTARRVEPGPVPTMVVDPDACLELGVCLQDLRAAGFELKATAKGVVYLVDKLDPYGVLAGESFPTGEGRSYMWY